MGLFADKKIVKQNESILKEVQLLKDTWTSFPQIKRESDVLASNAAMRFSGNDLKKLGSDDNDWSELTYSQIQNNQLPSYMSWDYWVMINQWADYWVNRYKINTDDLELAEVVSQVIRMGILYGSSAITKDKIPGYVYISNGKATFFKDSLNQTFASIATKDGVVGLKTSDKAEKHEFSLDEICAFSWRFNNIGDFVWCMKDILTDLYLKKIIESNASLLVNKALLYVSNPETMKTELALLTNPFKNYGVLIKDSSPDTITGNNKPVESSSLFTGESHIPTAIEAYKFHVEVYYAKFGRQITSSKNQSLSSDASLSVSSSELIADEHDRRVRLFIERLNKFLGVNLVLAIDEVQKDDMEPENENADQEGEASTNTTAHDIKEKAE